MYTVHIYFASSKSTQCASAYGLFHKLIINWPTLPAGSQGHWFMSFTLIGIQLHLHLLSPKLSDFPLLWNQQKLVQGSRDNVCICSFITARVSDSMSSARKQYCKHLYLSKPHTTFDLAKYELFKNFVCFIISTWCFRTAMNSHSGPDFRLPVLWSTLKFHWRARGSASSGGVLISVDLPL